jgi:hypothetical protein
MSRSSLQQQTQVIGTLPTVTTQAQILHIQTASHYTVSDRLNMFALQAVQAVGSVRFDVSEQPFEHLNTAPLFAESRIPDERLTTI